MHVHRHVHYVPYHEMACTIELRSPNSISVPNLVAISQNFLNPEDPSQMNFAGPGTRSLHRTGTVTTKACLLGKHTCYLHDWHQPVWPVRAAKELQVQNICTCTALALCTPAPSFIRLQVGLAKVDPRTKFGVASSRFP